jgi:hypothetical protein
MEDFLLYCQSLYLAQSDSLPYNSSASKTFEDEGIYVVWTTKLIYPRKVLFGFFEFIGVKIEIFINSYKIV